MTTTFSIANIVIILFPVLKFLKVFMPINPNSAINEYSPGYIKKDSTICPLSNNAIERCKPQPIHSKPNNFLLRHGSM